MAGCDLINIVKAHYDGWNARDYDAIGRALSGDFMFESDAVPAPVRGREGMKQFARTYLTAFPDLRFTIQEIIESGGTVVAEWTATGTHRGELYGLAPTGRYATVRGCNIYHFDGDEAIRSRSYWDTAALMRQLDALPVRSEGALERERPMEAETRG
jgi:steroid delta-isomerase-like uncharacterized protein